MAKRRGAVALLALALSMLAVGVAGCGEGDSVAAGATVHVYVAAPLCAEADRALQRADGKAEDVRVEAVCLDEVTDGGRLDLATVGVNARRATEDSTTVAFLEAEGRGARFSQPIVEAAGIVWIETESGATAMRRVLDAVAAAGSGSLRASVHDALE